jgi:periplasmic protein TonB
VFDNYVGAKQVRRSKWVTVIVAVSIFVHAAVGAVVIVRSLWTINKLEPPDTELALGAPPPPPPPPPAGSSKPKTEVKKTVKKVKEPTQPDPEKKPEPAAEEESEDEGVEGGVEGGVAGGVVGGVLGGVEGGVLGGVSDAPPKPQEPKVVPQVALEAQRISGEKDIQPPNDVATQIARSGKGTVGVVKMCLAAGGSVQKLNVLKSTGYPGYDNKIKSKMREWKYRPFMVNGKAVPVCTSVTFIYRPAR